MELHQGLSQKLGQGLRMNPQLHQAIKILQMPAMDLRETIADEIEQNPALEILEDKTLLSLDDALKEPKEEDEFQELGSDTILLRDRRSGEKAADENLKFIEGALSRPETLQEHLLWQLRLLSADDNIRRIGELLVQNLDEDGFHEEPLELLLKGESPDLIGRALRLVRSLDPAGTCTADYRESLRVQVALLPDAPPGMGEALSCLELLEQSKFTEAAQKLGLTEAEVRYIFERIKELSPFPGRQFTSTEIRYVIPDLKVIRQDDELRIRINDEEIPVLRINRHFEKITEVMVKDKPAQDFARGKVQEARGFIQSIKRRKYTLKRVARAIVKFQRPFFINGPKYLAPLTLQDIADDLGIDKSTVSRTASGKYLQSEWGIFELRHFFSNSISGTGSRGSHHSQKAVMENIRELTTGEDRRYSDNEIANLLAQQGISVSRRTVAKYRKMLGLGSSYAR